MNKDQESGIASFSDRCKAAIWGQFVGDALCLGSHWIYDLNELRSRFPEGVAGFEAPGEGHYHAGKKPGEFTHYGDAALLMLQSIAEKGFFTPQDFGARFVALFSSPDYHGYLDHATKGTLENFRPYADKFPDTPFHFQGGADDDQPATATRLAPVVVAHAEDDELLRVVESATRVCQNNSRAVVYMKCHALIVESLLGGSGLSEAVKSAASSVAGEPEFGRELSGLVEMAFGRLNEEVREVTLGFGQSCPLTSSFPAALHAALKFQDDPRRAFIECANAGGDNAARCAMIGTWLGARFGFGAIPSEWRDRLAARQEIAQCIDRIVKNTGS